MQDLGCRTSGQDAGLGPETWEIYSFLDLGLGVLGLGLGFKVWDLGFRVWGLVFGVQVFWVTLRHYPPLGSHKELQRSRLRSATRA